MSTKLFSGICLFCALFVNPLLLQPLAQTADSADNHAVQVAMKNVMYHYTETISVHIFQLQGELAPLKVHDTVVFDDKNSFHLVISSAEISIACQALAEVLNHAVFSSADAPFKDLIIESKNDQLIIKGKIPQKANVAFETIGTVSADPDGRIRLHTDHVKAAHLPLKGLMDLIGVDLARLVDTNSIHGLTIDKDDLILDPEQIFPPPHIRGKVTAVRIEGNDIVLLFGTKLAPTFALPQSGNYMAFRHGYLKFGRLVMEDSDLTMIDMDPRDPFDFYLTHYQEQLVAGYTKSTMDFGLRVHTRDYNKLRVHHDQKAPSLN